MDYPQDLLARANFEMETFERCAADTCKALMAEVVRLRNILAINDRDHSHECKHCFLRYTPAEGDSEDCPSCGSNGQDGWVRKG